MTIPLTFTPFSLDRANLNNAYVSGMREDLNMVGNDITIINTIFWCGYFLGQIPNNLAMQYFRPRIWMPFCMLAWVSHYTHALQRHRA